MSDTKTDKPKLSASAQGHVQTIWDGYRGLIGMGWREMMHAPKDTPIQVVTLGSTGVFVAHWLAGGGWFVEDGNDLWPATPMLWEEL